MITSKTILGTAAEYATLAGMKTEDLLILQHHVTPARRRVVLRVLADRGVDANS